MRQRQKGMGESFHHKHMRVPSPGPRLPHNTKDGFLSREISKICARADAREGRQKRLLSRAAPSMSSNNSCPGQYMVPLVESTPLSSLGSSGSPMSRQTDTEREGEDGNLHNDEVDSDIGRRERGLRSDIGAHGFRSLNRATTPTPRQSPWR